MLKNQAYRGSSSRTVYHGGDKDVPGMRRYRPETVPVKTRLLPASSRFATVFDSLPGYSRCVPVVLNKGHEPVHHGSSRIIKPG